MVALVTATGVVRRCAAPRSPRLALRQARLRAAPSRCGATLGRFVCPLRRTAAAVRDAIATVCVGLCVVVVAAAVMPALRSHPGRNLVRGVLSFARKQKELNVYYCHR